MSVSSLPCLLSFILFTLGLLRVAGFVVTPRPIIENGTYINPELGEYHARLRILSRSCRDIKENFGATRGERFPSMTQAAQQQIKLFLHIKGNILTYWLMTSFLVFFYSVSNIRCCILLLQMASIS